MSVFANMNVVYYYVADWEKAKAFYDRVLDGWPVAWSDDEIGWREYGREHETHFAINRWSGSGPMPAPNGGGGVGTFGVEDVQKATDSLRGMGVKCDDPVIIPGVVSIGTFYDPEGNRLQFAGSPPPA